MVWKGDDVDAPGLTRKLIGATDPLTAGSGTIRGDFGIVSGRNIVHGSDSQDSALREIDLWFDKDKEIIEPVDIVEQQVWVTFITFHFQTSCYPFIYAHTFRTHQEN